jgi:hypothetical protein
MNDLTHNFTPTLKIKFAYFQGDYFAHVEEENKSHKIPLLLGHKEVSIAMEGIKDIKGPELPFKTFCLVVTGYLSTIIKYKSPQRALAEASQFRDPL